MTRRLLAAFALSATLLTGIPAAPAADTVRVGMLKPNVVSVIYWIAVRTGAFDRAGLKIEEHPFPSGQSVAGVEQLLRGNLDFYIGAGGEMARANSHSIEAGQAPPLVAIEAGDRAGTSIVLAPPLAGATLETLKARDLRIGVASPSSTHLILLRGYLAERGMTTADLRWRFITLQGSDMVPALLAKQLDGFMHDALTATIALDAKAGFIFMNALRGDMGPKAQMLPNTFVTTTRKLVKENPDLARRFVGALEAAGDAYTAGPKAEMVAIIAEWTRQEPARIEAMLARFDPRMNLDRPAALAWWEFNASAMKSRGEILDTLAFDDLFDLSFTR